MSRHLRIMTVVIVEAVPFWAVESLTQTRSCSSIGRNGSLFDGEIIDLMSHLPRSLRSHDRVQVRRVRARAHLRLTVGQTPRVALIKAARARRTFGAGITAAA
jgi:hypothetical protein